MIRTLLFLFFLFPLSAEVNVIVSRKNVKKNETITIIFSSDERLYGVPDFSPLEQDFTILSQNQSSSTSIINGKYEQEYRWTLGVLAKREGELVIPSIQFGSEATNPAIVKVAEATPPTKGDPLYFEIDVSPKGEVYERSQILYTFRFYHSTTLYNSRLGDLQVSDPDALIEQVGQDREFEKVVNKKRYAVFERTYAVFPQHSGELILGPITFEGQIMMGGQSLFNMQTQYTQLASEEKRFVVKPIPPPFNRSNWFAANQVTLSDDWSGDITQVVAGEPITRTVTIMADGCISSQIPQVSLNLPTDIKQYPDKPKETDQNGRGIRQMKVALIPTEAGEITLPEIVVKWWDIKTDRMKEATLPSVRLNVVGAPIVAKTEEIQQVIVERVPLWAWALISLHGVWVLIFFWSKLPKRKRKESTRFLRKGLKASCFSNDAKGAERYLLKWGKVDRLSHLKVSEDLQGEIELLQKALYGNSSEWKGAGLWFAFKKRGKKKETSQKNDLKSLLYS